VATWFKKDLGDGVLAGAELDEIERLVKEEMLGGSEHVAAFTRHTSGDLHCSVQLYLTPTASGVAASTGAHPCGPPVRSGLTMLAGPEGAWALI
jgi:hypothetical protein